MPNTPDERQTFKQAVALIARKYSAFLPGNVNLTILLGADTGRFDAMVKFMDHQAFMTNRVLSGGVQRNCTVLGFTNYTTNPPTIYINRSHARPSTFIHELLHFFTHANFDSAFQDVRVNEGVTEYLTRKVQGAVDPNVHANFAEPRASYEAELRAVYALSNFLTGVIAPNVAQARKPIIGSHRGEGPLPDPLQGLTIIPDFLEKAYFSGDAGAIALFRRVIELMR